MPLVFRAPTVMTLGELPGEMMAPMIGWPVTGCFPRLPAERPPRARPGPRARRPGTSGSSAVASIAGWPSETFSTRMLYRALFSMAQSMASMTSLDWPLPSAASTRRLTMCAPGAMPRKPPGTSLLPAMMPATWVPWP